MWGGATKGEDVELLIRLWNRQFRNCDSAEPGSALMGSPERLRCSRIPLGVFTFTAPVGTVVLISEFDTTANVALVPLNVTLVEPFRFVRYQR
jgi:hypothetical protein